MIGQALHPFEVQSFHPGLMCNHRGIDCQHVDPTERPVGPALDRISAAVQQHRNRQQDAPMIALNVNALATFSVRWLLRRTGGFRAEHSDIEVRLSTSNETVDALADPFDVVICGGPDSFLGYTSRFVFGDRPYVIRPRRTKHL